MGTESATTACKVSFGVQGLLWVIEPHHIFWMWLPRHHLTQGLYCISGGQDLMDPSQHQTAPNTVQDLFLRRCHLKCVVGVEGHGESEVLPIQDGRAAMCAAEADSSCPAGCSSLPDDPTHGRAWLSDPWRDPLLKVLQVTRWATRTSAQKDPINRNLHGLPERNTIPCETTALTAWLTTAGSLYALSTHKCGS